MKYFVQSISSVITNSSSEVFCQITGEDLDAINEVLSPIFQGVDDEFEPVMFYNEEEHYINIDIPYGMSKVSQIFMKAGLETVLSEYKCNIDFDVEY